MLSLLECMGILNPSAKLSGVHLLACLCKGCASILVNCARDLALTEIFVSSCRHIRTNFIQGCSCKVLLLGMHEHMPQNAVSYGCRISLSCQSRIVVDGGHLGRVPCGALHWLVPSQSGLQSVSWNSPITPVRGQTLREGASVRPSRKPILELMGPCSRGLPAKYLSCHRS